MTEPAFSPERLRYIRLSAMIKDEGRDVALSYLETYYCGKKLENYLTEPQVKSKLDSLLKRPPKVLNQIQYDTLYPKTGTVDIKKMDLSLLFVLIRSLNPGTSPNDPVWTDPIPENLSTEADIARIIKLRNWLDHVGVCDIENNDYVYSYQTLKMILERLVKNINQQMKGRDDYVERVSIGSLSTRLNKKYSSNLDPKPEYSDVMVGPADDPVYFNDFMPLKTSENTKQEYADISLSDDDSSTEPKTGNLMDKSTSTSSLQKQRQLSFRIKKNLNPFKTKKESIQQIKNVSLPNKKTKVCNVIKRGFLPCIGGRCSRGKILSTTFHMDSASRCMLSGLVHLKNGATVVIDTIHDSLQMFNAKREIVAEIECTKPRGICAMSDDTVIVTLKYNSRAMIYRCDTAIHYVNDVKIACDAWMYDVKYTNGIAYVLCEKNEIHMIDFEKETDIQLQIPSSVAGTVEFFDMTPSGEKFFLSDGKGVVCIDKQENVLWCYRSGKVPLRTNGIVLIRNKLLVAAWERCSLLQLTLDGTLVREMGKDLVQNPLAVYHEHGLVYVTQYMSSLNEKLCREIITLRY